MIPNRTRKHYPTNEVLADYEFLTVMDVYENYWLLEHTHDFPEMICVLSGHGTQYINGTAVTAKQGEIYIIPVGITHVFRPNASPSTTSNLHVRNVILRPEWLLELSRIFPDSEIRELISWLLGKPDTTERERTPWLKIIDARSEFRLLTEHMRTLVQQKPPLFQTLIIGRVADLLSKLCLTTDTGKLQQSEWPPKLDIHPVKLQILETIQALPLSTVSLKEIARMTNRSERQLSRLFQRHFETPFKSYIQDYRIQTSMKLLKESSLTVKDTMNRIGFEDANHFYNLFKSKTGMTPGQYRKFAKMTSSSI
ncbi:AraC family transcriptional regulator [Paenibacillus sp. PAMC21692]|uniref:AraC family transcriptional regulator n=1 Tax=Paenibacillus sp. PAMC21692 TaxID=2762320 RepID=UPI00164DB64A|nr:AraC family transcriptional regulator [Paenibacillus sp. PAMC21692]QNK56445.1 helix-turn-helix transcriptional regulator [Paenibacillus sp. PAMC21692]